MRVRIKDRNRDGRGRGEAGMRTGLVSQAHPGEELVLRIDRVTRGTVQGRVARLLVRDPERVQHECVHEFHCTGCPLLAATPVAEAGFKMARLREVLAGLPRGWVADPEPLLCPGPPFGYRHLAKQIFGRRRGRVVLGSYVAGTHQVVDNRACPVLAPALRTLMDELAAAADQARLSLHRTGQRPGLRHAVARLSRASGEMILLLVTSEDPPQGAAALAGDLLRRLPGLVGVEVQVNDGGGNNLLAGEVRERLGQGVIEEDILGFGHRIGIQTFCQVNPAAAAVLLRLAVEAAGSGTTCLEGHAGVGAMTLPLSRHFERVVAVEAARPSARALAQGARRHGCPHVEVVEGRLEDHLGALLRSRRPEVVVLDPPRAGAGTSVMEEVGASTARRVVLLSCDPASLARDLPPLLERGFRGVRVVPVDQFPRTAHLETLLVAERP